MRYAKELDWCCPTPTSDHWESHSKGQNIREFAAWFRGDVVDYGCNNGIACSMLSRNSQVKTVTGIDISSKALIDGEQVIIKMDSVPDKIRFIRADLCAIPLDDDQFDAGICFHTLEHIYPDDLDTVLGEVRRTLKPGAFFLLIVPCEFSYKTDCHVSFFSFGGGAEWIHLPDLLERNGFEVLKLGRDFADQDAITAQCRRAG